MVLLPLHGPSDRPALRFGDQVTTYRELDAWTAELAGELRAERRAVRRVAVWATPERETVVAVVAALRAGVPVVPVNPRAGEREIRHILTDSDPELVYVPPGAVPPGAVSPDSTPPAVMERTVRVVPSPSGMEAWKSRGTEIMEPAPDTPAVIVYTSGTTGPPKGVVLPRRAIATNLDALADAWQWTAEDTVAHGLPMFHVHGLILGMLGPLRLGGTAYHVGPFSSDAVAAALDGPATMLFGVPTMYHRLAGAAEADPDVAAALARARLLVSGSAALPAVDHERILRATGQRVVQRYGMTETLMNTAVPIDGGRRAGTVGPPLPGVHLRLVDDEGRDVTNAGDGTIGEVHVRGPNLFLEYLNRPDATSEAFRDGWFRTGDVATRSSDGYLQLVGRLATDLIKSGGYKIGAGEIENALLDHPAVAEAVVTGTPDADLGERVVAWIVPVEGQRPEPDELASWVTRLLAPHKRPREVHLMERLPRNDMGKVLKRELTPPPQTADRGRPPR